MQDLLIEIETGETETPASTGTASGKFRLIPTADLTYVDFTSWREGTSRNTYRRWSVDQWCEERQEWHHFDDLILTETPRCGFIQNAAKRELLRVLKERHEN